MRKTLIGFFLFSTCSIGCLAQTFGPNSPTSGTNTTSIGSFTWTSPGNVVSSNNAQASVTSKGVTNYLSGTNFGFTIPVTTSINGIQLDIEKSTLSPTVVTILNNWTSGLTNGFASDILVDYLVTF